MAGMFTVLRTFCCFQVFGIAAQNSPPSGTSGANAGFSSAQALNAGSSFGQNLNVNRKQDTGINRKPDPGATFHYKICCSLPQNAQNAHTLYALGS